MHAVSNRGTQYLPWLPFLGRKKLAEEKTLKDHYWILDSQRTAFRGSNQKGVTAAPASALLELYTDSLMLHKTSDEDRKKIYEGTSKSW